jgi:hypothetical protein
MTPIVSKNPYYQETQEDLKSLAETDPIKTELSDRAKTLSNIAPECFSSIKCIDDIKQLIRSRERKDLSIVIQTIFKKVQVGVYVPQFYGHCRWSDGVLVKTEAGDKEYRFGRKRPIGHDITSPSLIGVLNVRDTKRDMGGKTSIYATAELFFQAIGANWPLLYMEYQRPDLDLEGAKKKLSEKGPGSYLICNGPIKDVLALCAFPGNAEDTFLFTVGYIEDYRAIQERGKGLFQQVVVAEKEIKKIGNPYTNLLELLNSLKKEHPGKFTSLITFSD